MVWPFTRKRKIERAPLLSEIEAQAEADRAKEISATALQRTLARGPVVSGIVARQAEIRERNGLGEMFEESMRRVAREENR